MAELERLHKLIAHSGLCSRRAAEKLIEAGRVTVDGELVDSPGTSASPNAKICVDGRPIPRLKLAYLALNKPAGYVTTMSDPQGRKTVKDLLPRGYEHLKPAGRLDQMTEGLLILTNDGDLAAKLTHPRHGVEKEYRVTVAGSPDDRALRRLSNGVVIHGKKTAPAKVRVLSFNQKSATTILTIVLHQGMNRQVRLMCEAVGHRVVALERTRIGPILVRGIPKGGCKVLGKAEIAKLVQSVEAA